MSQSTQTRQRQSLRIQNSHPKSVIFCIEPWAEELPMDPGTTYEIVVEGPQGDSMQVECADERITVYGWTGSVASAFHEGKEVIACRIPAPPTPTRVGA
jgi:hypothetical protein